MSLHPKPKGLELNNCYDLLCRLAAPGLMV